MYRSALSNMFLLRYKLLDPIICEYFVFFIFSVAMGRQEMEKQRSWDWINLLDKKIVKW